MIVSLRHFLGWLVSSLSGRADLVLENLALRRQLLALHAQRPRRRLTTLHKLFWVALRMCWSAWRQPLVLLVWAGAPVPGRACFLRFLAQGSCQISANISVRWEPGGIFAYH